MESQVVIEEFFQTIRVYHRRIDRFTNNLLPVEELFSGFKRWQLDVETSVATRVSLAAEFRRAEPDKKTPNIFTEHFS